MVAQDAKGSNDADGEEEEIDELTQNLLDFCEEQAGAWLPSNSAASSRWACSIAWPSGGSLVGGRADDPNRLDIEVELWKDTVPKHPFTDKGFDVLQFWKESRGKEFGQMLHRLACK